MITSYRKRAIVAGMFFILAAVTSIFALYLYTPIITDAHYILKGEVDEGRILWAAFLEILLTFCVVGTAITLYPVLKKYNESMATATVVFRLFEAMIIALGIISLLTMDALRQEYLALPQQDSSPLLVSGQLLLTLHKWTFLFGPNIMLGPSTFMTAYALYRLKLVPSFISLLGMIGGPMITFSGVLVMFGLYDQLSTLGALTALPVFFYEMSLAGWLVVKGFAYVKEESIESLYQ